MLRKLTISAIKYRWKDYLILFSGLIISSAIFYLFETLATNNVYLHANGQLVSIIGYIFSFGAVLLMLITFVYINYANSFLLSMRQHDYGLFMILGARRKKIGQMIWLETVFVGIVSTVLGIIVGIGLSALMQSFVLKLFSVTAKHYAPFWGKAVIWTLFMYLGLFLLAAFFNTFVMTRKSVLKLLHSSQEISRHRIVWWKQIIQVLCGLGLLGTGYWFIMHPLVLKQQTIPTGLFTLSFGTFFLFNAVITAGVAFLRKTKNAKKGLRTFTLGQLEFRIHDYTKILTGVAMLFALALGAITTGIGFNNIIEKTATAGSAYTLGLVGPTAQQKKLVTALRPQKQVTYLFKSDQQNVYFIKQQFEQEKFEIPVTKKSTFTSVYRGQKVAELQKDPTDLMTAMGAKFATRHPHFISERAFAKKEGSTSSLFLFRTEGLTSKQAVLDKLVKSEAAKTTEMSASSQAAFRGSYDAFKVVKPLYSGLQFMGIFLGIAFLAMLASCLMFKLLSGAFADKRRYELLRKLGVRPQLLRNAIKKEVGLLFLLPALVGVVHVLFGLNLFKGLLGNPYYGIWIPFTFFAALYFGYYVGLVLLYQKIVLSEEN
ncbi:FtsX-like permease family protein [Liquorilactobacillus satsumensis]|uniref:FtsX-like permease family protein n=1 Tax=Liquorilactobacillus satsumensis TaxID=259059 RepID=UPI0021C2AABC|nr:ABC transporter permease [Liquorilactobacillus satsumensis]MCP9312438.1 ABC transporter permease [Liquorilactobacillus satsumensis]MCP9358552.1 ABC transporter permease [Liquorilactobacillus satsumensis]MCP9359727.1 ABC transporter permease [Liquorilactobacillus satsumensis]MCP9372492.1 ABC transporter permease [Liquorilactobacillus satsumensis]